MSAKGQPPCENSRAVHISPHNSGTVIDSVKRSIMANRKLIMCFLTSHQSRPRDTLNVPQMGFRYTNLASSINFDNKTSKVCYKVSSSKNFQRQSCSVINYLPNGINILARDNPVPVKFGPKGTNPNR